MQSDGNSRIPPISPSCPRAPPATSTTDEGKFSLTPLLTHYLVVHIPTWTPSPPSFYTPCAIPHGMKPVIAALETPSHIPTYIPGIYSYHYHLSLSLSLSLHTSLVLLDCTLCARCCLYCTRADYWDTWTDLDQFNAPLFLTEARDRGQYSTLEWSGLRACSGAMRTAKSDWPC